MLEKRLKEKDANHYLLANLFECEYRIGDKKMAIEMLTKCFEQFSIAPIDIRDYLFDKLDDTKISELIRLEFGQKAIESIVDAVNEERQQKERFIEQQHKIADFIKNKMSEVHNK